ncbi:unnamed protein product [Spodoptera exigua]|nr:unnamed protein product [Spodoptera exigua]
MPPHGSPRKRRSPATVSAGLRTTSVPLAEIGSPWAVNEPNNVGNNENCITFNAYGEIADRSCDEPRPYICFRSGKVETEANECGTIDSEYQWDRRSNSCYKLHTVSRTFADAHFACSAEGGHLAIIKSDVEATVLKELYAKYPPEKIVGPYDKNYIMVGFHSWADSSDWRTIHGETLKEAGYSKFAPGEPNNASTGEFCGSISRGGLFNDLRCEIPTPFICEKKPDYPPVCSQSKNQYNFREKS